jgi:hypothetical protein
MAIEIVDLPSYKMLIFLSYVNLPEGKWIISLRFFWGNESPVTNHLANPMAHLSGILAVKNEGSC